MSSTEEPTAWSDDDIERILLSLLIVVTIPGVIWYFLKPGPRPAPQNQQRRQAPTAEQPLPVPAANYHLPQTPNRSSFDDNEESILNYSRKPPHSSLKTGKSHLGHSGILPFKCTLAATYESRKQSNQHLKDGGETGRDDSVQLTNRKDRARIFTKLFASNRSGGSLSPPGRGSNIIVSIPASEICCPKLRRVLLLLGTYFNLFLLISLPDEREGGGGDNNLKSQEKIYKDDKLKMNELIRVLRGGNNKMSDALPEDVIPSHRIVGTNSISSKVAFVRQLPKSPAFVLDFEAEMSSQLTRFGFTVLTYSPAEEGSHTSGLGLEMIM